MSCPLLNFNQSDFLIQVVDTNSNAEWQAVQIQISWLLKKPTDLDLHCLQSRVYPGSAGLRLKGIVTYRMSIHENFIDSYLSLR